MENDLVRVRLLPTERGIIDDYRLKSNPQMTLSSLVESRDEILRGSGIIGARRPLESGNRDALWPGGINTFGGPYTARIEQQTADKVCVVLSRQTAKWKVERVLTLTEGDAALDIVIKLTNTSDAKSDISYWSQSYLRLADDLMTQPGLANEIVLMPARVEAASIQGVSKPQAVEEVYIRDPEDAKNQFVPPHQPWMAAVDRSAQVMLGMWYGIQDFPRDTVFYSWPGNRYYYSMEVIYPREIYEPGQTRTHHIRMIAFANLTAINLLRPTYAIYLSATAQAPDIDRLVFKVVTVSSRSKDRMTYSLGIDNGQQSAFSEPVTCAFAEPGERVVKEIELSAAGLKKGSYGVLLREADGQTFKLTGQTVTIP
ncbi:MAG: hypothetical protein WD042_19800 [Phycisphaeraceae bacterium]